MFWLFMTEGVEVCLCKLYALANTEPVGVFRFEPKTWGSSYLALMHILYMLLVVLLTICTSTYWSQSSVFARIWLLKMYELYVGGIVRSQVGVIFL